MLNYPLDYYITRGLKKRFKKQISTRSYDAVIINYVVYSKLLDLLPVTTLKIIETHDSLKDRWKILPGWYSMSQKDESKGLDRADVVIAIQNKEAEYFKTITEAAVLTISNEIISNGLDLGSGSRGRDMLYLGADYPLNQEAIGYFIEYVFRDIVESYPDLKLLVVGSICGHIESLYPEEKNIVLLGHIDDLEEFYGRGHIAINPMMKGTGLKIKNVEALSFGKELITTSAGAYGMEAGINDAFYVADKPQEFQRVITRILENSQEDKERAQRRQKFIKNWNLQRDKDLKRLIHMIKKHALS